MAQSVKNSAPSLFPAPSQGKLSRGELDAVIGNGRLVPGAVENLIC
jgi:hypothetical protein